MGTSTEPNDTFGGHEHDEQQEQEQEQKAHADQRHQIEPFVAENNNNNKKRILKQFKYQLSDLVCNWFMNDHEQQQQQQQLLGAVPAEYGN